MKMDDDMEDEIVYEFFTFHFQMVYKYLSTASISIVQMVSPGPGQTFKTILFQPGTIFSLSLFVIVSSLFLQTRVNWLQRMFLSWHRTLHDVVAPDTSSVSSLKSFVASSIGDDNVTAELVEGAAGVYALQGRRGAMEDRFSVMQKVDVGGQKPLSFFGVYDGHGGQYVAEFVKQNLFNSTIEKIKQLKKAKKLESSNINGINKSIANESSQKIKNSKSPENDNKDEKELPKNNTGITDSHTETDSNISATTEEDTTGKVNLVEIPVIKNTIETPTTNLESENNQKNDGNKVEEITIISSSECSLGESLKKEDLYSTVSLRRKNSKNTNVNNDSNKKKTTTTEIDLDKSTDHLYMDSNSNINYTRLLTDTILDIDEKVTNICKSKVDFSGSTAVVAVLDGEHLIVGNVGDSRAVMGDLKGATIPLSVDHKPNQIKEMKRIKEAGGFITFAGVWRVAGILATSRALGDFPLKDPRKLVTAEPDVLTFSLKDHKAHFVVLATDGLWDVMSNEEVVEYVREHIHEKDFGAKSLVMYAYNKGSMDNITVTVLNISLLDL